MTATNHYPYLIIGETQLQKDPNILPSLKTKPLKWAGGVELHVSNAVISTVSPLCGPTCVKTDPMWILWREKKKAIHLRPAVVESYYTITASIHRHSIYSSQFIFLFIFFLLIY